MGRTWTMLAGERWVLQSQVALRLEDDFTSGRPLGRVSLRLEFRRPDGRWLPVERSPVLTPTGVSLWPGIGLTAEPQFDVLHVYRVRVEADFYGARHLVGGAWNYGPRDFDVRPFSHDRPIPIDDLPTAPTPIFLLPSPGYPFPTHVTVLRGLVIDEQTQRPARGALVTLGLNERVLTDAQGAFALPVRRPQPDVFGNISVDAELPGTGRTESKAVPYPNGFGVNQTIRIP